MLYKNLTAPLSTQIEITTACTNNCLHCYNYQKQQDLPEAFMAIQDLEEIISKLNRANVFSIVFTGGEPLLLYDVLIKGIELCNEYDIKCSINTNLTNLNDNTLNRMKNAGKFSILTSLASFDRTTHDILMNREGAYDKTVNSMKLLNKHKVNFSVNMVVTNRNYDQVYETGKFAHTMGAKSFSATKASPPLGCSDYSFIQPTKEMVLESLDELLRLNEDFGIHVDVLECYPYCFVKDLEKYSRFVSSRRCSAGVTSSTVDPIGNVRPCSHSDRIYGNLLAEDIETIYNRMTEWRTGELLPKECMDCEYFLECSGGCRCEAEYEDRINSMDPYCSDPSEIISYKRPRSRYYEFKMDDVVSVLDGLQIREEKFGYILHRSGNYLMVSKDCGELIKELFENELTVDQCLNFSSSNIDDFRKVFSMLKYKKLVNTNQSQ